MNFWMQIIPKNSEKLKMYLKNLEKIFTKIFDFLATLRATVRKSDSD
jgi:hypothetical protein